MSRSIKEKTDSKDQMGAKTTVKAMSSIREQAIEKYTALTRHKRELLRKNQKIQTRIAQHLRKNKIELTSSTGRALAEDEEKSEYTRLLQELADTAGLCFCRLQQHYCAAEYKYGGLGGGKG